mmetsp:Transcript_84837/g.203337  ORF Transcript_84837/g.203337 Transcript_84837/m.203337 type:complete len:140 (-) Transcript_84837:47-466(-)
MRYPLELGLQLLNLYSWILHGFHRMMWSCPAHPLSMTLLSASFCPSYSEHAMQGISSHEPEVEERAKESMIQSQRQNISMEQVFDRPWNSHGPSSGHQPRVRPVNKGEGGGRNDNTRCNSQQAQQLWLIKEGVKNRALI